MTTELEAMWNETIISLRFWDKLTTESPEVRVFKGFPKADDIPTTGYKALSILTPALELQIVYLDPCRAAMKKAFMGCRGKIEGIYCAFRTNQGQQYAFQLHELQ